MPSGQNPTYFFGTLEITHWVNLALRWVYAATLAMQFILALGNRPKGEVYSYVASFVIFGVSQSPSLILGYRQSANVFFLAPTDTWLLSYCLRRLAYRQSILGESPYCLSIICSFFVNPSILYGTLT